MHKKYYEQSVSKADKRKVKSLVDFHNQYIKSTCLIKRVLKPHQSLLDIACGRGGDINKWMEAKAGYVLGIDIADNNILNPEDGAYERYVGRIKNMSHPEYATKMVFAVGDSSKNIVTGEAYLVHIRLKVLRPHMFHALSKMHFIMARMLWHVCLPFTTSLKVWIPWRDYLKIYLRLLK